MAAREADPGHGKPKCGAKGRSGKPCGRPAGWGTDHVGVGRCKMHGGSTPTHRRGAAIELQRRACDRLGVPVSPEEGDPGALLLGLVREAAGNVEFYRSLVAELPTHPEAGEWGENRDTGQPYFRQGDPGVYGPTYHPSGIPTGEAKPHILVVLYGEERDRLARFTKEALAANVEERRLRLEESDARELMTAFAKGIHAAKLTPEQTEVLRREFANHLRRSTADEVC